MNDTPQYVWLVTEPGNQDHYEADKLVAVLLDGDSAADWIDQNYTDRCDYSLRRELVGERVEL